MCSINTAIVSQIGDNWQTISYVEYNKNIACRTTLKLTLLTVIIILLLIRHDFKSKIMNELTET